VSSRILTVTLLVALTQAGAAWADDPSRPPLAAGVQQLGAQAQAAQSAPAETKGADKAPQAQDSGWKVEIAPIYLWAPFNISTVTLPQFPELPAPPPGSEEGGRPSGKTGTSLNGAAMAAFRIEKSRWMLRGNAVWAGLSGERDLPRMKLSGDLIYGEVQTGFRVVRGLWVEGGVRRLAVDVDASVLDYPTVSRKPGVWDPIVGATYRLPMGNHWLLTLHGDGGGFGVGSQVDSNVFATLDWRLARHFGLTLGYSLLYFRIEDSLVDSTRLEKTLKFGTTLHGPIVGFKLLF
jgi:hypothetical protein